MIRGWERLYCQLGFLVADRPAKFMTDNELKLQQQVRELKGEVRRLRRMCELGVGAVALAVVFLFPQLLLYAFAIGACILFALLVSPVRHLIFPSVFKKPTASKRHFY